MFHSDFELNKTHAKIYCGYKPEHDTDATNTSTDIIEYRYTEDDLGKIVDKIIGGVDSSHFYDPVNGPDQMFSDHDSESDSDSGGE